MVISAAQTVNFLRTQPINFLGAQKAEQAKTNLFMSQTFSAANSPYHLEHPKIAGSEVLAKHLDLVG